MNFKRFFELPEGIRRMLIISISREIQQYPGENGVLSQKLCTKLIQLGIADHMNITFKEVEIFTKTA